MKVCSHLKAGQLSTEKPSSAQSVVSGLVGNLQKDVENLRIWSMIRVSGPGLSSWTFLSQKPQAEKVITG